MNYYSGNYRDGVKHVRLCALAFAVFVLVVFSTMGYLDIDRTHGDMVGTVIVITGSMEPVIKVNSLSVLRKCSIDDVTVGDIVTYIYGDTSITHRVTSKEESDTGIKFITTKGDANKHVDQIVVTDDMLIGKITKTYNSIAPLITYISPHPGVVSTAQVLKIVILIVILALFIRKAIRFILLLSKGEFILKGYVDSYVNIIKNTNNLINDIVNSENISNADKLLVKYRNDIDKANCNILEVNKAIRVIQVFK